MTKQLVLISILAFFLSAPANALSFYLIKEEDVTQAEQYFAQGDYAKSKNLYLKLAGAGDKYAQYVLSIIALEGLVGEPNLMEAYAWAKVAKESSNTMIKKHFETVSKLVKDPNEDEVLKVSSEIYSRYSNLAVARRYLNRLRKELPKCTGSRIRGNITACNRIGVVCEPTLLNPSAREECLKFIAKIQPENMKKMKSQINQLEVYVSELELQAGSVTISEQNN